MSCYRLREKISYQLHSQGRHGMHSPFVYELIEQVLQHRVRIVNPLPDLALPPLLPARHEELLRRIAVYYGCEGLACLDHGALTTNVLPAVPAKGPMHFDTILLARVPGLSLQDRLLSPFTGSAGIIACSGLYATPEYTAHWRRLAADPSVTLSLDLFELGLLFFRPDFLVKQHFRLKF